MATRTIVFYPISAIVTLFCNILWDPLHPCAEGDLRLLDTAPNLIRYIRRQRMTEHEVLNQRAVDSYLVELARLAKHAVSKAREEQCRTYS